MKNLALNIFKIKDDIDIERITEEINGKIKNDSRIIHQKSFERQVKFKDNIYIMRLVFFMKCKEEVDILWYENLKNIFEEDDYIKKEVYSAYGILLIYNKTKRYIITFGKANYITNEYIDTNFGLDMASKMLTDVQINAQSSKFFSFSKSKSLVVYNKGKADIQVGEAVDLIEGNIKEMYAEKYIENLLEYIYPKVTFASYIKIIIKLEKVRGKELVSIMDLLYEIQKKYKVNIPIPKLVELKEREPIVSKLKDKINSEFITDLDNTNINLSLYTWINSEMVLLNNVESYILKASRYSKEYDVLTLEDIRAFMQEYNIYDLYKIQVIINFEGGSCSEKLYKLLEYTTEIEGKERYCCLSEGKWRLFNKSYMKFVENAIENINKEVCYDEDYNFVKEDIEQIIRNPNEELKSAFHNKSTKNENGLYNEYAYNFILSKNLNGKLLDRKNIRGIEIADIYANKELIHTKIGKPSDFNECINQSIRGADMWNNNKEEVKEKLDINDVETVTLLLITDNKTVWKDKNIIHFRSLRFKINLIEWNAKMNLLNLKSKIIIARKE